MPRIHAKRVSALEDKFGHVYPEGVVLLAGSSLIERWTTSAEDLAPLQTVNVGIGGTKIGDQREYLDRLVTPFKPRALVLYAGSNDINGIPFLSKRALDVVARIKDYIHEVMFRFPGLPVFYVAITEAPIRSGVRDQIQEANRLLREWADASGDIVFIDTSPALLTASGDIDSSLFGNDRLHFNQSGYTVFAETIREALFASLNVP